eukprot:Nk52_evm26s2612 gene=Nk52_evmTU26s2612
MPSENVKVCVRQRPLFEEEAALERGRAAWEVAHNVVQDANRTGQGGREHRRFIFDHAFSPALTEDIYGGMGRDLVKAAMDGYNGTIFAYGQTNSGKTYTMKGIPDEPGLIPLTVQHVFDHIEETHDREFLLRVSYLEIYNEIVNDLLAPDSTNLPIHQTKGGHVYVGNLKEIVVGSLEQVMSVLASGEAYRHVSKTDYNLTSSRSHTIFTMVIESREKSTGQTPPPTPTKSAPTTSPGLSRRFQSPRFGKKSMGGGGGSVRYSCLNLIDLAGSERISNEESRRKEGAFINKSLLTLGNVISKLSEGKGGHIPYRDSKLTRILQNSLTGNAKIGVICTISPTSSCYDESLNTLKFASRAKKITTSAEYNEILDDHAMLKKYKLEIEQLKMKLRNIQENGNEELSKQLNDLKKQNEQMVEELQEKDLVRVAMKERINQLTKMILTSTGNSETSSKPENARKVSRKLSSDNMFTGYFDHRRTRTESACREEAVQELHQVLASPAGTRKTSADGRERASSLDMFEKYEAGVMSSEDKIRAIQDGYEKDIDSLLVLLKASKSNYDGLDDKMKALKEAIMTLKEDNDWMKSKLQKRVSLSTSNDPDELNDELIVTREENKLLSESNAKLKEKMKNAEQELTEVHEECLSLKQHLLDKTELLQNVSVILSTDKVSEAVTF